MVQNKPTSPGAADTAWTTPASTSQSPVVSAIVPTNEYAETPDPILSAGLSPSHPQADDVAASVAGSVLAAQARYHAHEVLTHPQGSALGVQLDLPEVPTAHSKHVGGDGDGYASG